MTLSRDFRALGAGDVGHVRGIQHALNGPDRAIFPLVLLFTESELRRREERILADPALSGDQRMALVTKLNGGAARMAIDAQQRIVLPPHFVAYLALDKDVFLNDTNTTIQVWNPTQFLRWSGRDSGVVVDPLLTSYLAI